MFMILTKKLLPPEYNNKIVYNFRKNLYSLKKLPFEDSVKLVLLKNLNSANLSNDYFII